jgi:hypothetical protein
MRYMNSIHRMVAEARVAIATATDEDLDSLTTLGYVLFWMVARRELRERLGRPIGG